MTSRGDPVVASVGDAALHASDARLIGGSAWWNDAVIAFVLEHFAQNVFGGQDQLLFVLPSTSMLMNFVDDPSELRELLAPLRIPERELVFMPVNDNAHPDHVGGSHWSLLVVEPGRGLALHFDSMKPHNCAPAAMAVAAIGRLLGRRLEMREAPTRQQGNGYDCGVHVCISAELIALKAASATGWRVPEGSSLLRRLEAYSADGEGWLTQEAVQEYRRLVQALAARYTRR
eukprot:tig00000792_g4205.t1